MRGVVGGYGVYRAVPQSFYQRLPVFRGTQGRVHLEASVLLQVVLAQGKIVRSRLAAHPDAPVLGAAYQFHALLARYVTDMVAAACHPAQLEVALYLPPFALGADAPVPVRGGVASLVDVASAEQRVVFAVGRYYAAEFCAEFHCAEHHLPVLDSASVVRERDALPSERLEVYKFLSLAPLGYRCVGGAPLSRRPCLLSPSLRRAFRGCQVRGRGSASRIPWCSRPSPRPYCRCVWSPCRNIRARAGARAGLRSRCLRAGRWCR